jgi:hypothetical protein
MEGWFYVKMVDILSNLSVVAGSFVGGAEQNVPFRRIDISHSSFRFHILNNKTIRFLELFSERIIPAKCP